MIELSKEATESLDLKSFWPSLLFVALLFGLFFGFEMLAGHVPSLRYTGALLLLNGLWAVTIYRVARFGWKVYSWTQYAFMIGLSLQMGRYIFPDSFIAGSPVQALGTVAIFSGVAPHFFTVSRKQAVETAERTAQA